MVKLIVEEQEDIHSVIRSAKFSPPDFVVKSLANHFGYKFRNSVQSLDKKHVSDFYHHPNGNHIHVVHTIGTKHSPGVTTLKHYHTNGKSVFLGSELNFQQVFDKLSSVHSDKK